MEDQNHSEDKTTTRSPPLPVIPASPDERLAAAVRAHAEPLEALLRELRAVLEPEPSGEAVFTLLGKASDGANVLARVLRDLV